MMVQPRLSILAGPPRAGKTQLGNLFDTLHSEATLLHTDDCRKSLLERHQHEKHKFPALYQLAHDQEQYTTDEDWLTYVAADPNYIVERTRRMDTLTWRHMVISRITDALHAGQSIIVEGVAAFPELAAGLPFDFHYVAIGTQHNQFEHMLRYARTTPNIPDNWMYGWSDRKIKRYSEVQAYQSRLLEIEANRFGFPYIEMSEGTYSERQQEVLSLLTDETNHYHGPLVVA